MPAPGRRRAHPLRHPPGLAAGSGASGARRRSAHPGDPHRAAQRGRRAGGDRPVRPGGRCPAGAVRDPAPRRPLTSIRPPLGWPTWLQRSGTSSS
ncbi:hypothetical protein FXB39_01820 [Nocardioides sp. BGMRC 2183]|nr:hypothetical protein FXB39_01820 [Nocardioides sp. BGMRC 2183]